MPGIPPHVPRYASTVPIRHWVIPRQGPEKPIRREVAVARFRAAPPRLSLWCLASVGIGTVPKTLPGHPHSIGPQNPREMSSGARHSSCRSTSPRLWCLIRGVRRAPRGTFVSPVATNESLADVSLRKVTTISNLRELQIAMLVPRHLVCVLGTRICTITELRVTHA